MQAVKLRCEYHVDPLGLTETVPRLSWEVAASGRDRRQSAYQVVVASSPERLLTERADTWDSGRVESDESLHIPFGGPALTSRQRCWWRVRLWDEQGRPGEWSAPARWTMGLLDRGDWSADWIMHDPPLPPEPAADPGFHLRGCRWVWLKRPPRADHPQTACEVMRIFARKTVSVPAGRCVTKATFLLTADDQWELYCDGREVGRSDGAPDAWQRARAVDLTAALTPGQHLLAVTALNTFSGPAGLVGRLQITLDHGDLVDIRIDSTWLASDRFECGWQDAGHDDGAWQPLDELMLYGGEAPWWWVGVGGRPALPPAACLRREFATAGEVVRATAYVTARGLYELRLNGAKVGDQELRPGWTDYRRRIPYQTYDVTAQVRQGGNALAVTLADGWYSGYVGFEGREVYGPRPSFLCQLELELADGRVQRVVTDSAWQGSLGPVLEADTLHGERHDARLEQPGWDQPGFGADWAPVTVVPGPEAKLEAHTGEPVRKLRELPARKLTQPRPGVWVYDLGQVMLGWARLKVTAPAGTAVTLRFAEALNPDGTVYRDNLRTARCADTYVCRGQGEEVWEPRFTFRGFRYVELAGLERPTLHMITGVEMHSDLPETGDFTCSDEAVNQLLRNIRWTMRGNWLEVPMDCPQRDERLGWTCDAQLFLPTAAYLADNAAFYRKWLQDVADGEGGEGSLPVVGPDVRRQWSSAWSDSLVIVALELYRRYGDRRVLEQHYPAMRRWIDFCVDTSAGLVMPEWGFGDWLQMVPRTPREVWSTAYFAHTTGLVAEVAELLGEPAEAARLRTLAADIRQAFRSAFVAADGTIHGDTQAVYVFALAFDLLPEQDRAGALARLLRHLADHDGHLATGICASALLNPVLTAWGEAATAYQLLLNDTFPSWLFHLRHGATTVWERWDGWTPEQGFQRPSMNSFCHVVFGAVGQWLFEGVAGIQPDRARPGFHHFFVRPYPSRRLDYARAVYHSVRGEIRAGWRWAGDQLGVSLTVPANCTATVELPWGEVVEVGSGEWEFGVRGQG